LIFEWTLAVKFNLLKDTQPHYSYTPDIIILNKQQKQAYLLDIAVPNSHNTGCLIKNASTHNFFIYYPISMNKKTEDMVFHALRSSHEIIFFWRYFQ
jgi:hypothetical protein